MADRTDTPQAVREAVQPSLWDRLLDELHDLGAEAAALRRELVRALGDEAGVETLLAGGARAIATEPRLDDDARRRALRLGRIAEDILDIARVHNQIQPGDGETVVPSSNAETKGHRWLLMGSA